MIVCGCTRGHRFGGGALEVTGAATAGDDAMGADQVYAKACASDGGTRKYRLNSRLNCDGLSYPTS
jgi:hypothetical protein